MRLAAKDAAAVFRRAARALPRAARRAEKESLKQAVLTARQMSVGPYSLAHLAAMGHPYSRRRPRPPQEPAIINLQSGLFIRGWQDEGQQQQGGTLKTAAVNMAPYSGYLDKGTRLMIRRPLVQRVKAIIQPGRVARLAIALAKLFRG